MKKRRIINIMFALFVLSYIPANASPTPVELQLTYLSVSLAQSDFKEKINLQEYYDNADESFKNTVRQIANKHEKDRNIIPLTREEFEQLATYSFDKSVNAVVPSTLVSMQNDKKTGKNAYCKVNGEISFTNGETFVKSEKKGNEIELKITGKRPQGVWDETSIAPKSENLYLVNMGNKIYMVETSKRLETAGDEQLIDNVVKASDALMEVNQKEPFVSIYNNNSNMENAKLIKKPKTNLKKIKEGTERVYSITDEVEIVGPKKQKNGTDVSERKELKNFFNDERQAEAYLGKAEAPPGQGLNLDGIKALIENIVNATKGILEGVKSIPEHLKNIYNFIVKMFDVSEFKLDLTPLKIKLLDRFPFCIPKDFLSGIKLFNATVKEPKFEINIKTQYLTINETLDASILHYVRGFFRYVAVAWYSIFLIMSTRKMIKW